MSNLKSLFEQIQLQDLLSDQVPPYHPSIVEFVNSLRAFKYDRKSGSFFMDFLSYGAFIDIEQHFPDHIHETNSKCAFKSFNEFLQVYMKNLDPQHFNDGHARDYLIHRITCTGGLLHYQIQVWLRKCSLLHELVISGVNVNATTSQKNNKDDVADLFLRTASRIPVSKQRDRVILALTNPLLTTSKRARLEDAYQATR